MFLIYLLNMLLSRLLFSPYLICVISSSQKNDIVSYDEEIVVAPSMLHFSYKLFVWKHVVDIVINIVAHAD